MGLFDQVLGGAGSSGSGGMSPINMALLGLLAYRTFEGKGRLADMLGRSPGGAGAPLSWLRPQSGWASRHFSRLGRQGST
jgi:hypothetical protein